MKNHLFVTVCLYMLFGALCYTVTVNKSIAIMFGVCKACTPVLHCVCVCVCKRKQQFLLTGTVY